MVLNKLQVINIFFALTILGALYITSLFNYLLFHSIAEIFSICIAFTIFLVAWNSKQFLKNNFLIIMGIAYLFIGFLDLLHTLSYKGMNIFTDYDYYANQLWIATRFMESITIFSSFLLLKYKGTINTYYAFTLYFIATIAIILSIFYWKVFPVCFIEGEGLTRFKIISEYVISLILVISLVLLYYYRNFFDKLIYKYISLAIIFTIISELAFTLYISNYGFSNMIGHYFKIFSFYMVYKAIIEKGIKEPNRSIFMELQSQVDTDGLTRLYNYRYLYERLEDEIKRTLRTGIPFSIIIFDIDYFKRINDKYGHLKGDEALLSIGKTIKSLTRNTDIVGRYGGEEFMVILPHTNLEDCFLMAEKIRNRVKVVDHCKNGTTLTISAGIAEFNLTYKKDENKPLPNLESNLVDVADNNLYKAKFGGRDMTAGYKPNIE